MAEFFCLYMAELKFNMGGFAPHNGDEPTSTPILDQAIESQLRYIIKNKKEVLNLAYVAIEWSPNALHHPEVVKQTLYAIITKHAKDETMDQLLIDLVDHIWVIDKNHLEFHLKHMEGRGDLKTDALEVIYSIRKTQYRLEHCIVF